MPYYITDESDGCPDWAVVLASGRVIGCHPTRQRAINQMVLLSVQEGIEPGGELGNSES